MTEPIIKFPKAEDKEVVKISPGQEGMNSGIKTRFDKIDQVLYGVMLTVILSMIAIIVSVVGLFIDQMRFNNTVYKEYSQKTESVEITQKLNQELLYQNKQNQDLIIELQKQIERLIKK